jgi:membrane associated rhomboid family serine protease
MNDFYQNESRIQFGFGDITYGTQRLILVTAGFFAVQLIAQVPMGADFIDNFGFTPADFLRGYVWQPITSVFLHGGLHHLFVNMLILFMFGPTVERALGTRQFISFYLISGGLGVLANFVPLILGSQIQVVVIGASGACIAVLIAFAVLEPNRKIFLFPFPFPISAKMLVAFIIIMNLISGVGGGSNTSVATHFGGMIVGFLYMKIRPWMNQHQWRQYATKRKKKKADSIREEDKLANVVNNIFEFKNPDKDSKDK